MRAEHLFQTKHTNCISTTPQVTPDAARLFESIKRGVISKETVDGITSGAISQAHFAMLLAGTDPVRLGQSAFADQKEESISTLRVAVFPGKQRPGALLSSCTFFARPKLEKASLRN